MNKYLDEAKVAFPHYTLCPNVPVNVGDKFCVRLCKTWEVHRCCLISGDSKFIHAENNFTFVRDACIRIDEMCFTTTVKVYKDEHLVIEDQVYDGYKTLTEIANGISGNLEVVCTYKYAGCRRVVKQSFVRKYLQTEITIRNKGICINKMTYTCFMSESLAITEAQEWAKNTVSSPGDCTITIKYTLPDGQTMESTKPIDLKFKEDGEKTKFIQRLAAMGVTSAMAETLWKNRHRSIEEYVMEEHNVPE